MLRVLFFCCLLLAGVTNAQDGYRYSIDLTNVKDDVLQVELLSPKLSGATVLFSFPKIIPGTYRISDYGKFISNLKAFNKAGKSLAVSKKGENQWRISDAMDIYRITYTVEDIFDTEQRHDVYPMAATDFEEDKVFVLHTPGLFGFFDGISKRPIQITVQKPSGFFGSSALLPSFANATTDVFTVKNLDELYDSPILYSRPDTTTMQVGNTTVLVSVYSPGGRLKSKEIAGWMGGLLNAAKAYLGGQLPAERYAFLYYFHDRTKHSFPPGLGGALEHTTSSFYYLPEVEAELMKSTVVDISSHEFFHIITPLTISSKEVKEFNFNTAVLSKHLWLYEGVTEYMSHHVQVKHGMNTTEQFLDKLSEKITTSRTQYNDALPFTVMSKGSAAKYKDEYNNVYEKGALIAAVLDVYLLHLSDGRYGLRNLTHDLGARYGKDRYFNDDELFDEIAKRTYPEVRQFFSKYVEGTEAIPYGDYFALAGVGFAPDHQTKTVSFGGISPALNSKGKLIVGQESVLDEVGMKMGYKVGDELKAFNGVPVTLQTFDTVLDSLKTALREGSPLTVTIERITKDGRLEPLTFTGKVSTITASKTNALFFNAAPDAKQLLVRKAWLGTEQLVVKRALF